MTLLEPAAPPVRDGARSRLVAVLVAVVLGPGLVVAMAGPGIPLEAPGGAPAVTGPAVAGR